MLFAKSRSSWSSAYERPIPPIQFKDEFKPPSLISMGMGMGIVVKVCHLAAVSRGGKYRS